MTGDATAEERRTNERAHERASGRIAVAEHNASAAIEKVQSTAEQRVAKAGMRAAELREHAGMPPEGGTTSVD